MHSSEDEDLTSNPFFVGLKRQFPVLYQNAEENCFTICVPTYNSLGSISFVEDTFNVHILKPSGMFQGVYETFGQPVRTAEIEGDRIKLVKGWSLSFGSVKILFDELFYNKKMQPFKVLCIERPLVEQPEAAATGGFSGSSELNSLYEASQLSSKLSQIRTASAARAFLNEFPENAIVLRSLKAKRFDPFSKQFAAERGREMAAVPTVKELVEDAVDQLVCANVDFRRLLSNRNHLRQLNVVVEMEVMSFICSKLFEQLAEHAFPAEDESFYNKALAMQNLSLIDIGVRSDLVFVDSASDLGPATAILSDKSTGLDSLETSPIEKIYALKDCIDEIRRGLSLGRQRQQLAAAAPTATSPRHDDESRIITTDDVIPLLAWILIQAKPRHAHTALFMMQHFVFSDILSSELGYNIVSIAAAFEYVKRQPSSTAAAAAPSMRRSFSSSSAASLQMFPGRRFGSNVSASNLNPKQHPSQQPSTITVRQGDAQAKTAALPESREIKAARGSTTQPSSSNYRLPDVISLEVPAGTADAIRKLRQLDPQHK